MINSLKPCAILANFFLLMCLSQPLFGLTLYNRTKDKVEFHVRSLDKDNNQKVDKFSLDKGEHKDLNLENCASETACIIIAENTTGPTHGRGILRLDNASKNLGYFITPSTPGKYRISPV